MVRNARLVESGQMSSEEGHVREVPILVSEGVRMLRTREFRQTGLFFLGAVVNGTVAPTFAPSMVREGSISATNRGMLHAADGLIPGALNQSDFSDH
jgi:hypothetical protein